MREQLGCFGRTSKSGGSTSIRTALRQFGSKISGRTVPNPGDTITGGVEFFMEIDWNGPLNVATDITVIGIPEQKAIT